MGTGTSTLLQQMLPLLPVGRKHYQGWGVSSTDSRSLIPALFVPVSWLLAFKAAAALAACVRFVTHHPCAACTGEHYHQHSNPHDAAHGPAGYSQQGNSHPAHHSPYTNPYHPADAQQAAAYMAAAAAANMRAAAGAGGEGHPSDIHQQHYQQQQQQQQQQGPPQLGSPGLPEAAPSTKTDPVELSLLTTYLRVVRQTQVRDGH